MPTGSREVGRPLIGRGIYSPVLGLLRAGLALGLAGWLATSHAAAETNRVWIEPASVSVPPGGSVTIEVMVEVPPQEGVPPSATGGLGSWDFNIGYDDEVLSAVSCTSIAGGGCRTDLTPSEVRMLGFVGVAYEGVQTMGSITFDVIGESGESSPVIITYTSFNNSNGDSKVADTVDGAITIQQPLGSTPGAGPAGPVESQTGTPSAGTAAPPESQVGTPSAGTAAPPESQTGTPSAGTAAPPESQTGTSGAGTAAPGGGEIQLPVPGSGDGSAGGGLPWAWLLVGAVGAAGAGGVLFVARARRLADRRKAAGPNSSGG